MSKASRFAPVAVNTLKQNITELLTEAIFSGKLKPGERLNESQLSREFHVSRAPIREALQHLQEQGLVMNSPRRGMFVVYLEDEDVQKINSVRLILEAEALRLARSKMKKAQETALLKHMEALEDSELAAPFARTKLDFDFHKMIWAISGNDCLQRTLEGLTAPLFAHSVLRILKSDKVRHIIFSHRPLMAFLQGKAKTSAEEIIAEHLRVPWVQPDRFSSLAPSGDAKAK